jgi:DNA invertase Pin-like site-specific DNA recombinase
MSRRQQQGNPRTAVAYIRVSTDEQQLGQDAQRAALERWCAGNGVTLAAVHVDQGVSGAAALDDRPGLIDALAAVATHQAGVLLVTRRDRLARDVVLAATVERLAERSGARVVSADGAGNGDTPEAQLMRTVLDAVAQYERALIRARTRAALAVKKKRGERTGQVPLGHTLAADGTHLAAHPDEARAVARVHELRAAGASIRGIAKQLATEGITPRGATWHPTTVARVLARPRPTVAA